MNDETKRAIAAELRAQAESINIYDSGLTPDDIASELRARADELDPPAAPGTESVQPAGKS